MTDEPIAVFFSDAVLQMFKMDLYALRYAKEQTKAHCFITYGS